MVQKLELSGYSCVWEEGFGREREQRQRVSRGRVAWLVRRAV